MAEPEAAADAPEEEEEKKKGGGGMLFGIIGAVVLGGVGFFLSFSGLLPIGGGSADAGKEEEKPAAVMMAAVPPQFIPIENLVISLGTAARAKHLRFGAQLEVEPEAIEEVEGLKPRIIDIMNTFLRAVEERDIEAPTAMTRLRAQLLRRVQIVTGEGKIKDLLITEFVLN